MKKILIFSTAYFPFIGGAEVAVKELTERIGGSDNEKHESWSFDMVTARLDISLPSFEKIGRVNVYRIGFGWPKLDKYLLAFYGHFFAGKLYKKNKYDAIWAVMASYGGFAAMFFKAKYKVPFLLSLQEGDDFAYILKRAGFLKSWFKKIFLTADVVQCISHYLANWAKASGATGRIEVIPNGVDVKKFARIFPDFELENLKKENGKKDDDVFIIHTGRLVKKNGLDSIIKALVYLPPNIKFLSVGSGADLSSLKSLASNSNLNDRVIFIEYVSHDQLVKYLKISDIFIRPSLSEGLGNSFLEAMAAGLPVIGTPVGGIPDFLFDRETGLFCKTKDPESIAEKIKIILNDEMLKNKLIKNGRKLVEEKYDWDKIAFDMKNVFSVMLNGH
jgi:glycosyltransferase involved in cell wall biosynthesis